MDVKCPRCENEFEHEEMAFGFSVECVECGLLIATEMEEDYDWNHFEWSNDTPADCCKACENLNLKFCIGICNVDSAE